MEKILIVRLGAMGDVIHAMPAVRALRDAAPGAKIGWAVEERWAELLCADPAARERGRGPEMPLVDAIHFVNTRAWRKALLLDETWREVRALRRELRDSRYDAAYDFQGAIKSALVAWFAGAGTRTGFTSPRESAAAMFYTRKVEARAAHVIEQNMELASVAGAPQWEFPFDAKVEDWAEQQARAAGSFAIVNPGAGWGAKVWPAERYGAVARALRQHGLTSLVNHGPGEEALAQAVVNASGGTAQPLRCSLAELVALTRRARVFVGGDTGPMHLASALGVPVVAIFGPTDPARNGPYGGKAMVLRSAASATSYSHVADADAGLMQIPADEVIAAARTLLARVGA